MTHVRGRDIFLSGPMTDVEGWNRPAFDAAEGRLKELGAEDVYNPAAQTTSILKVSHQYAMHRSLYELVSVCYPSWIPGTWYNLLVSLPGWEKSAGARLEREVAVACGIEVCELSEVVE